MRQVLLVVGLGQAEVGHPDGPVGVEQQVRRLDVAVEDPLVVGVLQGVGHLDADPRHALPVGLPPGLAPGRLAARAESSDEDESDDAWPESEPAGGRPGQ